MEEKKKEEEKKEKRKTCSKIHSHDWKELKINRFFFSALSKMKI